MRNEEKVELFRAFTIEEIRGRRELNGGSSLYSCLYYFFNGYYKKS